LYYIILKRFVKESCSEVAVFYSQFLLTKFEEFYMNKSELINELSEETTFSKMDVARVLDSFVRVISRSLRKGEKVSITGFGSFSISCRSARRGINPSTKQPLDLPQTTIPRFKPGKHLREVVKSTRLV
jgi:DNA-binding protein HU-beta